MANSYAQLGQSIGDILGTAVYGSPKAAGAFGEGADAGSIYGLRQAQTAAVPSSIDLNKAKTQQILYELEQARGANAITPDQLAFAYGLDVTQGPTTSGVAPPPGPWYPATGEAVVNSPTDQAKMNLAKTVIMMNQLAGGAGRSGNIADIASATAKGQDIGTKFNMQAGVQKPYEVASIQAAMEGKLPGRTGEGGGSVTGKVQTMEYLINTQGISPEMARAYVLGDPIAEAYVDGYNRTMMTTQSKTQAHAVGTQQANMVRQGMQKPGAAIPQDLVDVVYTGKETVR